MFKVYVSQKPLAYTLFTNFAFISGRVAEVGSLSARAKWPQKFSSGAYFLFFRRGNAISKALPRTVELGQGPQIQTHSTTAKRAEPVVKKSAMKVFSLK